MDHRVITDCVASVLLQMKVARLARAQDLLYNNEMIIERKLLLSEIEQLKKILGLTDKDLEIKLKEGKNER